MKLSKNSKLYAICALFSLCAFLLAFNFVYKEGIAITFILFIIFTYKAFSCKKITKSENNDKLIEDHKIEYEPRIIKNDDNLISYESYESVYVRAIIEGRYNNGDLRKYAPCDLIDITEDSVIDKLSHHIILFYRAWQKIKEENNLYLLEKTYNDYYLEYNKYINILKCEYFPLAFKYAKKDLRKFNKEVIRKPIQKQLHNPKDLKIDIDKLIDLCCNEYKIYWNDVLNNYKLKSAKAKRLNYLLIQIDELMKSNLLKDNLKANEFLSNLMQDYKTMLLKL